MPVIQAARRYNCGHCSTPGKKEARTSRRGAQDHALLGTIYAAFSSEQV
jgi:hypothetical protein